jgi:hypothetical protein
MTSLGALSANKIKQRNSRDHKQRHRNIFFLRIVTAKTCQQNRDIQPVPYQAAA